MKRAFLSTILFAAFRLLLMAQTEVYVHQSCQKKVVGVINHPEIVGRDIDAETILFNFPAESEPTRISFHIDTAGFKVERIWIDSSSKRIDLWVYNCKAYQSRVEHPNLLTREERTNNLYFDYLAQKFTDREAYVRAFNDFLTHYIQDNPDSYLSLNYVSKFAGTDTEIAELLKILEPANSKYSTFQKMKNRLLYKGKAKLGEPLPGFEAVQLDGKPFTSKSIDGKATVVMFWQSGCKWSKKVIPSMSNLQQKFFAQGVQFVYFSLDENRALWQESSATEHIGNWNISDLQGVYGKVPLEMGVSSTPSFFVLDGEHKVRLFTFGNEVGLVESELKRILKKR